MPKINDSFDCNPRGINNLNDTSVYHIHHDSLEAPNQHVLGSGQPLNLCCYLKEAFLEDLTRTFFNTSNF